MLGSLRKSPAYAVSLGVHLAVLVPLMFIGMNLAPESVHLALETFFEKERPPEEFTQELNANIEVSESTNVIAGAAIAGAGNVQASSGQGGVGLGIGGTTQAKIDGSEQFRGDDLVVNTGDVDLPAGGEIGNDLGESIVKGEPQAPTAGYGEAMDRMSAEILRIMREEKALVVWLFDESHSMKDDQQEIKAHFRKIYAEIGIQQNKEEKLKGKPGDENLLTAVHSFGQKMTRLTPRPTADDREIMQAIDKVGIDESGTENTCTAVMAAIDEYRSFRTRGKRKVMLILVTDESGGDGEKIDEAIAKAKAIKAPVYILGREALFGYKYARMRWKDPKHGLDHWLLIDRGPESAYYEALQFDGLHDRWDAHPSGFAPYEQARLCRESGGIFFVLPHEEQNLSGQAEIDKRKFDFLDMKEYDPELIPRKEYAEIRGKSRFRQTVFDVAKTLDPWTYEHISIQEHWYPALKESFAKTGQTMFDRGVVNFQLLDESISRLEAVRKLRDKEQSQRWRANYDLALAQCKAYRVRIFQFLLIMDGHLNSLPDPQDPKHNVWNLVRTRDVQTPTPRQIKLTRVDLTRLQKQEQEARHEFEFVIKTHPRTPWAHRAEYELNQGFGWKWQSDFRDPRYDNLEGVKLPTL